MSGHPATAALEAREGSHQLTRDAGTDLGFKGGFTTGPTWKEETVTPAWEGVSGRSWPGPG